MGYDPGASRLEGPPLSKNIFFYRNVGGGGGAKVMKRPRILLAQGPLKASIQP